MTLDEILPDLRRATADDRHAETGIWAASVLRERISAGQLAPGAKLSEHVLCDVLGVSRNTLREAFATLAGEHVVTRIPNRGVFVTLPSVDDVREIYRVRRFLEPAALMWCTDERTDALHSAIARARVARAKGSVPGMAGANQEFHAGVVALARSERLNGQMAQVLAEMRLVFHSMVADPGFHAPYIEENARILERFEAGDRAESAALMVSYLHRAEEQLLAARAHG
ncbi:GntR family transcriptional regulator [Cryobacterium psychrophilum]|uniref:GntR family transcriptional regulator n=1 Tax=Cryobacterium psychrophilum TaxID=41988 RepID=A0A4Y8KQP7_9MICO|nr:GntR family transcriptional regulator [Cryobacterium psychrophilum]TDW29396.1 GntR family transcriptional regulator [Cryobacterium psychrophilum]TFD81461.1 GntR family transcriptional regulator [Cryobacterium psychrophilum]